MKTDKYLAPMIVFGVLMAAMMISGIVNALNGNLSVKSIPALVITVVLLFFFVFFTVKRIKFSKNNRTFRINEDKQKIISQKFHCTDELGVIWLDEGNKLWQTRFTFLPKTFRYEELLDYKVIRTVRRSSKTYYRRRAVFKGWTADTTYRTDLDTLAVQIKLTNGKVMTYRILSGQYDIAFNPEARLEKVTSALDHIKQVNIMSK